MEGADEELRSRRSNLRLDGEREEITEVLREGDEESDEDHWEEEVEEIVDVREGDGRRRAVRRTKSELTLALAVHTIALCYYIYVLVWDSTVVKNHKGPPSVWYGSTPYGGRWKFLTFINMVSYRSVKLLYSLPPPLSTPPSLLRLPLPSFRECNSAFSSWLSLPISCPVHLLKHGFRKLLTSYLEL